jgi:hypothetical protein
MRPRFRRAPAQIKGLEKAIRCYSGGWWIKETLVEEKDGSSPWRSRQCDHQRPFHVEALMIYKLGSMTFAAQHGLHWQY